MTSATDLPRGTPESVGVASRDIVRFLDAVAEAGIELHSLMVFRAGRVIAEGWWRPYRRELPHMQHSLAKSFTATAVGLAIAEGRFGLDSKVMSFFPGETPPQPDPNLEAMTVRDLLTMRSGHRTGISGGQWRQLPGNWAGDFISTPVPDPPGSHFVYSSACSYMLSAIVRRVTDQAMHDYLGPRLFAPLGIAGIEWDSCPNGVTTGGNGLCCRTEDILKLGVLYLQRGMWEGQRILQEPWVAAATTPSVATASVDEPDEDGNPATGIETFPRGYGFHWWTGPGESFYASGLFGQYAIVMPEQDAVVALTASCARSDRRLLPLVWRHLRPMLGETPVLGDPDGAWALAARLAQLRLPVAEPSVPSPQAAFVSDQDIRIEENEDGITMVRFCFTEDRCIFMQRDARGEHRVVVGLQQPIESTTSISGSALHHHYQPERMRVVGFGWWPDETTFVIEWQFNETAFRDHVVCRVTAGSVRILRSVNVNTGATTRPALLGHFGPVVNLRTPVPDGTVRVGYDRNASLPAYSFVRDGRQVRLPFMPTGRLIPPGYAGQDFYVAEFSDAAIRHRWAECKQDPTCFAKVISLATAFTRYEERATGLVDPAGRIDPEDDVDLRSVRRPGYFGRAPYHEPIAQAEAWATIVEFTVPRDRYETMHLGRQGPIKLRGWHLRGRGVSNGTGSGIRALVIMNNGGGGEITAIDDTRSRVLAHDPATGKEIIGGFPDDLSEQPGMRHWRGFASALHGAGFDVLVTDRRGNGISGGVNGFNTAEQANDMFRELDQMESGQGLRILTASGELLTGAVASDHLLGGHKAHEIPVVLAGYSRGSYATAWAMHKNFVEDCDRDVPDGICRPPRGRGNIKGAILFGPNAGGLGYRQVGHDMIEAALRVEFNTTYYLDSDVLANIGVWPGVLIARGLWDHVEGLEGSFDAYRRAREPKEIVVFRGAHPLVAQSEETMRRVGARMVAYATAAIQGRCRVEGAAAPYDLKDLVGASLAL